MKYTIRLFILLVLLGFAFIMFFPLDVKASPECDCNEHSDCDSGYMCVDPMSDGDTTYNYCTPTGGYFSHCKPCKNEGEAAYYYCQCGAAKCTNSTCSDEYCCAEDGTYNSDTGECEYPSEETGCATCGDGTWDCTGKLSDNERCGDNGQIGNVRVANNDCEINDDKRFYCYSDDKWYSCDDDNTWPWVDTHLTSGDEVGSYCCDATQGGSGTTDIWSTCGDGNINSVCGEECEADSDCSDDAWTDNYQCSGDIVQRQYNDYYCDGSCQCQVNSSWFNITDCDDSDGCYDTTYRDYYCDSASCSYTAYENDSRCVNCSLSLTADQEEIYLGGSSNLSWSSDDTDSCSATWTSSTATSGTETVSPSSTTTYEMDCDCVGDTGTVTDSSTVTVLQPSVSISASPEEVDYNNSTDLSWTSSNVDTCEASGDWSGSRATSGTEETDNLTSDSEFILTCTNSESVSVDDSVTVTINNNAPSVSCNDTEEWNYCDSSRNPKLYWNYSDPDGDTQDAYQIQIDNNSGFGSPEIDTGALEFSSTSYQVSGTDLNWGTFYNWRIKVRDSRGDWSDWCSPICGFTTPDHAYPNVSFYLSPSSPSALQAVDFIDDSTCYDDNINGGDCTGTNDDFEWTIERTTEGDPLVVYGEEVTATFSEEGNWDVNLDVTDSDGYSCDKTETININFPLPEWKEISPK